MSAQAWTAQQDAVLWDRAGLVPPVELARLISEEGPERSVSAVVTRARTLDISLRKRQRRNFHPHAWLPEEDAMLRDLAGRYLVKEITRRLNERFRVERRDGAVLSRIAKLGLSSFVPGMLTARELRLILCVNQTEIKRLLRSGEIASERESVGPRGAWGVLPSALEAYMRDHPERLNVAAMTPSRWCDLARASTRRRPYVLVDQAARSLGASRITVLRLIGEGRLPGSVQYRRLWRIPVASVRALAEGPLSPRGQRITERRALALLSEQWKTGQQIAAQLGCDVGAVRAALLRARKRGVAIEGKANRGYRLVVEMERAS